MLHTTVRLVAAGAVAVVLAQSAREQAAQTIARIQRADYEGNREALRTLAEALVPGTRDRQLDSRVYYWRGFALWRRAFNGFNQNAEAGDLAADLERAISQFERASALDPAFADAKIGMVSCLQNLASSIGPTRRRPPRWSRASCRWPRSWRRRPPTIPGFSGSRAPASGTRFRG
jgi:hypothetical protein